MLKKLTLLLTILLSSLSATSMDQKLYIDDEEVKTTHDSFYIHLGENVWIETKTLHRDELGLYTLNTSINTLEADTPNAEYVKKWKCPYCNKYWPLGSRCGNPDCPSKYH